MMKTKMLFSLLGFYIGLLVLDFSFMYFCDGVHILVTREEAHLCFFYHLYIC
jgi:hypothetical protein